MYKRPTCFRRRHREAILLWQDMLADKQVGNPSSQADMEFVVYLESLMERADSVGSKGFLQNEEIFSCIYSMVWWKWHQHEASERIYDVLKRKFKAVRDRNLGHCVEGHRLEKENLYFVGQYFLKEVRQNAVVPALCPKSLLASYRQNKIFYKES